MDTNLADVIINEYNEEDDLEFKKKCFIVSQDIKEGRLVIANFIEDLQKLLVNFAPSKRALGMLSLNEVLKHLPTDFLNAQQLHVISLFYTERLNDHHQVLPAILQGLLIIIEFKHFPKQVSCNILNAIFLNVSCQQQQQADRLAIYTIFQNLLEKCKVEVLSLGLDFVYGIISSIDGERDPRNLLILLKWLKTFLVTVSLEHLVEEMFEVVACYFPIDFRTPSGKANEVSREDLADALCLCLCAIPEFAEYCIPLALEKLDSSLELAKLDSLKLLEESCKTFAVSSYFKHGAEIWSQIQKELFSGVNNEVKSKCLSTFTILMKTMSTCDESFKSMLTDINSTVKGNLLPDSKLFAPSRDILLHTALASRESAIYIIKETVPLLANTFSITTAPEKKAVILKTLTRFIKVYLTQCDIENLSGTEELEIVPILSLNALDEMNNNNNLIIAGFDSLSELAEKLPLNIRMALYKILQEIIIKPREENIRESILNCVKQLSCIYPDDIQAYVFNRTQIYDPWSLNLYLNAFCVTADLDYFRNTLTDVLLTYAIDNVSLSVVALQNMKNLLESVSNDSPLLNVFLEKGTIDILIEYVTRVMINGNENYELLQHISSVMKILIDGQKISEVQNEIVANQLKIILNSRQSESVYTFLLDGLLSRLRKVPSVDQSIIDFLIKTSLNHQNDVVRDVATQLLANLINKLTNDEELCNYLTYIRENYLQNPDYPKYNKTIALSWITKALIMRNHIQGNSWTQWLLDLFEEDSEVAKGFTIIMNDNYESLSLKSYSKKTLLYRQKFFIMVTDKLGVNCESKNSYLYAIGYLLASAPEQVILLHFKKIYKLMILCLERCDDTEILLIILNKIKSFISKKEPILEINVEDFISRILTLTTFEHSMKVRIAALQCLSGYTTAVPLYKILPLKQKITHELSSCTDDKKRLVRKEAMEARSAWFLMDAPI